MYRSYSEDGSKCKIEFSHEELEQTALDLDRIDHYIRSFCQVISEDKEILVSIWNNFDDLDFSYFEFNVELCDDEKIQALNRDYRQKDKTTDVLSFPLNDDLREEENFPPNFDGSLNLGDIIICESKTIAQASEFNLSNEEEFIHLMVHGFLHVLGFDHEINEEEEKLMEGLEEKILKEIAKKSAS